jgi:signal peptidase II
MRRYGLLALSTALIVALDQWSKIAAVKALALPNGVLPEQAEMIRTKLHRVTETWFNLRLAGNKGAAWSIFRDMPDGIRVPFFVIISVVAVGVIVHLYRKADNKLMMTSLALILAGALGNLIDRVRLGFVVDFIQWYWKGFYWPTFNVADIAISVGVPLMIVDMLRQGYREAMEKRAGTPPGSSTPEA